MSTSKHTPQTSARWCPLCGSIHVVAQGQPAPWPHITRNQIDALPALLEALQTIADAGEQGPLSIADFHSIKSVAKAAIKQVESGS